MTNIWFTLIKLVKYARGRQEFKEDLHEPDAQGEYEPVLWITKAFKMVYIILTDANFI